MHARSSLPWSFALLLTACGDASLDTTPDLVAQSLDTASADFVKTPLCGPKAETLVGPAWEPCAPLDSSCSVGAMEVQAGCCFAEPRPKGFACGAELACDGLGSCVADKSADRDGDKLSDGKDPAIGSAAYFTALPGEPDLWFEADSLEVRIDHTPAFRLPRQESFDLSIVDLRMNEARTAARVRGPLPWVEVVFSKTASHACYTQSSAEPKALAAQACKGAGVLTVSCPGVAVDGTRCDVVDGHAELHAEKLGYAWLPLNPEPIDLRLSGGRWLQFERHCPTCPRDGFPTPRLRLETCNGKDDDGDGTADEDGRFLCDDHLPCTFDRCRGAEGCTHELVPDRVSGCGTLAACAEARCGEPFEPAAGQRAMGPDLNGCFTLLNDDFCTNEFDGCLCNGVERCDPEAVARDTHRRGIRTTNPWTENMGCIADTPRAELPCEQLNGDGNACTTEACFEPFDPKRCRLHRLLQSQEQFEIDSYRALEFAPGVTDSRRFPGLRCPGGSLRYPPEGSPHYCENNNPCAPWSCTPEDGACHYERLSGPVDGCSGEVARGCGQLTCDFGNCLLRERTVDVADANECHGLVAVAQGYLTPSCLRYECRGPSECAKVPMAELCDDGAFCNGEEVCSEERLRDQVSALGRGAAIAEDSMPGVARVPLHFGCGPAPHLPCDDRLGCTRDACDEARDSCSQQPDDWACYTARGLVPNVCEPRYRCQCTGPDCDKLEGDGCSELRPGTNPCSDGNRCTKDICECADEFCTVAACRYEPACSLTPRIDPRDLIPKPGPFPGGL